MIYQWKPGARIKADPVLAAQVLDQLAKEDRLNAENVVDVSRPEGSALHDDFEWRDDVAAMEYRKHQARHIMNSLVIVEEEAPEAPPIRFCFQIEENSSNYTPTSIIMQSAESIEALKKKALSELTTFRMKYSTIIQKCDGDSDINALRQKIDGITT